LQATNNCVGDAVQDGVTIVDAASDEGVVAWHSGRTSVSDRRTFVVLRSTCG